MEEEECLRAGELEWILIKEPDSWSGSTLVINKWYSLFVVKMINKYLPWVFHVLLEGIVMITSLFKILYAQTEFLSFQQVILLVKRVIVILIYAD